MKTRATLVWLAAMMAAALLLPAAGAARAVTPSGTTGNEQVHAYYNFEQQIAPWKATTDSPYHAAMISQQAGDNGCPDMLGNHYAQLVTFPKGPLDQVGVLAPKYVSWTAASFAVSGKGVRQVTVVWTAKFTQRPVWMNGHPAIYVGTKAPVKGLDFATLPRELTYEWQTFKYQTNVTLPSTDTSTPVYVAVGWDRVGYSMDLDCMSVDITYLPIN